MKNDEEFNLADFLSDSLSLVDFTSPQTKSFSHSKQVEERWTKELNEDPLVLLGETVNLWKPRNTHEEISETPLQEFYKGLNILITGGTGFLGKLLIQKLIRAIPNLGHIYLLIRHKRGVTSQERLLQLFTDKVFLRMQIEVPEYMSKISVVEGDISEPGLGLSSEDRLMLSEQIHIVFHSAANVKFIEHLCSSLRSNLFGSKQLIDLAKEMKHLKGYVHISTGYSQCVRRVVEEKCYETNVDYEELLNCLETMTEEEMESKVPRVLEGWPNGYTFSKALTESMIQREARHLPICIYRPTVVTSTYQDPVAGWTDNVYGPIGMLLGVFVGLIHVLKTDFSSNLDMVPVDLVVNSVIAVASEMPTYVRNSDEVPVYNYSCASNSINWKKIWSLTPSMSCLSPLENSIWPATFMAWDNSHLVNIGQFLLHTIPGKVLDTMAKIAGQKPRLSKIYNKIDSLKKILNNFTSKTWEFHNTNICQLWNKLDNEDKKIFPFNMADVDMERFVLVGCLGLRYYFLKQNMDSIPSSARRLKWLKYAHYTLKGICCLVGIKLAALLAHSLPI